jgi:hypothetical protein
MQKKLSDLAILQPSKYGDRQGRCVWCGEETAQGLPIRVSDGFTGWGYFGGPAT